MNPAAVNLDDWFAANQRQLMAALNLVRQALERHAARSQNAQWVEALGGFLAGVIMSGQLLAVFMANGGGAWDNAKKAIEDEPSNPLMNTGKGSERHKAGVVGDTVGDPLKDTAGPALNPRIKVVNLVSLIAAPILVRYSDLGWTGWAVVILMAAGVVWGILRSKKAAPRLMAPEAAGD